MTILFQNKASIFDGATWTVTKKAVVDETDERTDASNVSRETKHEFCNKAVVDETDERTAAHNASRETMQEFCK